AADGFLMPRHGYLFDTILAALLVDENEWSYKMEDLAEKYLGAGYGDASDDLTDRLIAEFGGSPRDAKGHLWKLSGEDVARYGCQDIKSTFDFRKYYEQELERQGL